MMLERMPLAQAINNTGVQTLQNPCTIGGFYAASVLLGAGGAVGVPAVAWALDNPLVVGHWALGRLMGAGIRQPGVGFLIAHAPQLANSAYSACYD